MGPSNTHANQEESLKEEEKEIRGELAALGLQQDSASGRPQAPL